ncbi:TetR/AcrR family transcriptional regulator [Actinophytocola sp.]|uniref:TetR/AcrR family transcriptional regulator n=1 Tax=Actinophytocola sp. TaxID=1872138 RepID=UPI002D2C9002|nr:TetR/AcrR family transcriptional regulator [Actinophytocola sp.]HYQ68112.1 TetR/AcrR family transcriptional regulator [Actinophytocola sp.]
MTSDAGAGDTAPPRQTRRRGATLELAILRAAADELVHSGYVGLTMDRVAARAETNKNAIYRRWPDRPTLAVAAYRQLLPADPELDLDTGSLRSDALALLQRANARMTSPVSKVLRALLAAIPDDPRLLRELREHVVPAGNTAWLRMLARAVARGEARPEALTPRIATVAVDLLRNEYTLGGVTTIPESVLVEIVDEIFLPLVQVRPASRGGSSPADTTDEAGTEQAPQK